MTWSTACVDWERRVVASESLITFPPLFKAEAASALEVFGALKIVDATHSPTMADVCRPWINDFVAAIFGAYDPAVGRRLITEFFMLISKKNGKSTTAAGIMLTALIRNWRLSAEFLILAPTIEIANNSFYPARDMVKHDEELSDLLQVQDHYRTITHRQTGATLKVVAADSETVGGKKATGVVVDELWLFGKRANAENMLNEATGGMASRPEGFTIYLSTQSDEPPVGVFDQKLRYARDVRDGKVEDNRFLPVIYEFPDAMVKSGESRKSKNFYVTNPNLGASVDVPFLEHKIKMAEAAGEASMLGVFAKHLNIQIGQSLRDKRWPGAEFWERSSTPGLTLQSLIERCEVIDNGIDGGGMDDLLGYCVIGREVETRRWLAWAHAWAHPSVLERRKSEAQHFHDFAADGDLTLVENVGDDMDELAEMVSLCEESGKLDKVGVDPHGLGTILDDLVSAGVPAEKIVGISQGWKMAGPIKTAERKLAEGTLLHADQRLMAWCVGNAKVVPMGNALMITKQISGSAKIDPLMAMFDAVSLMALNPEAATKDYQMFVI